MVIELFFQHKMDGHLPTHPVNGSLVSWLKQMGQSFIISIISGIILPIDEVIFFKMAIAPPTSKQMSYCLWLLPCPGYLMVRKLDP